MNTSFLSVLEIGFGILYMAGAGFCFAYIRRHGKEFFSGFAESTWFSPSKWFIQKFVIQSPGIFTTTLILFQLLVAVAILSQGPFVALGLLAGTVFCLYAVFVSNVSGAIANLVMAVLQFYLASIR